MEVESFSDVKNMWIMCGIDRSCKCEVLRKLISLGYNKHRIGKLLGLGGSRLRRWLNECKLISPDINAAIKHRKEDIEAGEAYDMWKMCGDDVTCRCKTLEDLVGRGLSRNTIRRVLGGMSSTRLTAWLKRCNLANAKLPYIDADAAYLLGALLGDGGMYHCKRPGGTTEYRLVWTQKDDEYLNHSIVPRLARICSKLGVSPKIQIYHNKSRHEVRISCKKLYKYFSSLRENLKVLSNVDWFMAHFIRGFYDAEGRKSIEKVEIYNTNKELLEHIAKFLTRQNLRFKMYIRIKGRRRPLYVLVLKKGDVVKFYRMIAPEHPKLNSKLPLILSP